MRINCLFRLITCLLVAVICQIPSNVSASTRKKYPGGKCYIWRYALKDKQGSSYSLEHPGRWLSHKAVERRKRQGMRAFLVLRRFRFRARHFQVHHRHDGLREYRGYHGFKHHLRRGEQGVGHRKPRLLRAVSGRAEGFGKEHRDRGEVDGCRSRRPLRQRPLPLVDGRRLFTVLFEVLLLLRQRV